MVTGIILANLEKNPVGPLLDNSQPFGQHNGRTTKSTTERVGEWLFSKTNSRQNGHE